MKSIKLSPEHLVAHRGHQKSFPENGSLAILDAIASGAKKIEFDVQFTADGAVALYHDDNMQRISGLEKNITDLTRLELGNYSASEPERLETRFANNPIEFLEDILPIISKHQHIVFFF
jgi:glycerophosphoryl diester phosphodiesterase